MEYILTETRGHGRESLRESTHLISLACVNTPLHAHADSPWIFARSTTKPFQALPLTTLSSKLSPALSAEQLALCCASHTGTLRHQALIQSILDRAGLSEADLGCGVHIPVDKPTRQQLYKAEQSPSPLHHNCAGKHAGMLLACHHHGWVNNEWPLTQYLDPQHPLQQAIAQHLSTLLPGVDLKQAIDGCSAPTFYMPLSALATLYHHLITHPDCSPMAQAMTLHPELIGGPGRIDTCLMQATAGNLLVKVGADGIMAMAHKPTNTGVALKVWSGNEAVRNSFTAWWCRQQGWLSPTQWASLPTEFTNLTRYNAKGISVGEWVIGERGA
jgi:L-asparaginase II